MVEATPWRNDHKKQRAVSLVHWAGSPYRLHLFQPSAMHSLDFRTFIGQTRSPIPMCLPSYYRIPMHLPHRRIHNAVHSMHTIPSRTVCMEFAWNIRWFRHHQRSFPHFAYIHYQLPHTIHTPHGCSSPDYSTNQKRLCLHSCHVSTYLAVIGSNLDSVHLLAC